MSSVGHHWELPEKVVNRHILFIVLFIWFTFLKLQKMVKGELDFLLQTFQSSALQDLSACSELLNTY